MSRTRKQQADMEQRILDHGHNLARAFAPHLTAAGEATTLCKRLRRIEIRMHRAAERWCNGEITEQQAKQEEERAIVAVHNLLPGLRADQWFTNWDARGYALKLYPCVGGDTMHRDMGGYGILAPDLQED